MYSIEVAIAEKFLKRNGFIVASDQNVCSVSSSDSDSSSGGQNKESLHYACVWGIRINSFETRNLLWDVIRSSNALMITMHVLSPFWMAYDSTIFGTEKQTPLLKIIIPSMNVYKCIDICTYKYKCTVSIIRITISTAFTMKKR